MVNFNRLYVFYEVACQEVGHCGVHVKKRVCTPVHHERKGILIRIGEDNPVAAQGIQARVFNVPAGNQGDCFVSNRLGWIERNF